MKKFIFGITLSMLAILITILVLSKNKHISNEDKYYSIPKIQTYFYEKEKRMSFEIYANSDNNFFAFPEENHYYIKEDLNQYPLNNISVKVEEDSTIQEEVFFKYTIFCDILSLMEKNMILKDCELFIENECFSLSFPLGCLEIFREEYIPLEFNDLYGNYAYINGELHLIGITIQLDASYKVLQKMSIGPAAASLDYIEEDELYDSERLENSLKHPLLTKSTSVNPHMLTAKQNYYFIPISYEKLTLITNACIVFQIDNRSYYLEDFTYLASPIHLNQYQNSRQEGKIKYAQA